MRIDLAQYMKERYNERSADSNDPGPVITIAREAGCPGKNVAQLLAERLNQRLKEKGKKDQWKWLGKEVFAEAAKEIGLEPDQVEEVFKHKRSVFEQLFSSQSKRFYTNDISVRKTIGEMIRSMANDGHVIVLGRGGVAITRDIAKSLHIYLEAPLEWRSIIISQKEDMTQDEARKFAIETDKQREAYRDYYHGKGTDYTWYDVKYNCMTLTVTEIVENILSLMELKKLI